jgi:hypothetical protein
MSAGRPRSTRHTALRWLLVVVAALAYVGIIVIRQGPPSGGDTVPLTAVTSSIATGHLTAAASNTSLPNPPGYALLISPLVAAFPSLVGASQWCTTATRASALHHESAFRLDPTFAADVDKCGVPDRRAGGTIGTPLLPWYHSQGVLGIAAWLVLVFGALALLGAGGFDTLGRRAGLLAFLAFLPSATSAIVQLYHPQDLVSLGLALAGLAQSLRRRWVLAGALLGAAVVTKQFAVLLLLPALAGAPGNRARLRLALPALVVFGAGLLPFLLADAHATLDNLSGFSAGGAVAGSTVLSLSGATGDVASAIARDAPVLFAAAACLWAVRRYGSLLARPDMLVALTLACVGSRLVFESAIFPYYLLAASIVFFLLDLVARRPPHISLTWCAAAAFFVAVRPANDAVAAFGTLALAAAAVAAGFLALARGARAAADLAGAVGAAVGPP